MIIVKKIIDTGAGEGSIKCYKCAKCRASFYLIRETQEGREVHIPMCNVCLSAYLNYLDDQIIKYYYDLTHTKDGNEKK